MDLPRLEEHYELAEEIGRGGFGVVLAGRRRRDGVAAAIKVAHEDLGDDLRVAREVERLRALRHPRLAELHGLFVDASGKHALVYELVPGRPLDELLEAGVAIDPVTLARDLGAALDALHQAGLVHRDVKAPNVMAEPSGQFRLVDYGLLRGAHEGDTVTATGLIVGTVATMPPEQFMGERLGPRSDLYSLGCILFLAAEGRDPFPEANPGENLAAKKNGPPRIGDRDAFYRTSMHPDPAVRFGSGGEMAAAFARASAPLQGAPPEATQTLSEPQLAMTLDRGALPSGASLAPAAPAPVPLAAPEEAPRWRRPAALGALFLAVTLGAAMPGVEEHAVTPSPSPPPRPRSPVPPIFEERLAALEAWAYPPGMPWYVDLEDVGLTQEASGWKGMEAGCGPWDDAVGALFRAAQPEASTGDRIGLAATLPRVARVLRQIWKTHDKMRGDFSLSNATFALEGVPQAGYAFAVAERFDCIKDSKAARKGGRQALRRPQSAARVPPLEAALDLVLAARTTKRGVLAFAPAVPRIVRRVPASIRHLLFADLLDAGVEEFGFGGPGATHDEDGDDLLLMPCGLARQWDQVPTPPPAPPGPEEARAEALELVWRIRVALLAEAACGRGQLKVADMLDRLEVVLESPELDHATLRLVQRRLRLGERPLGQAVALRPHPWIARRLARVEARADVLGERARAPRDEAGWSRFLRGLEWEYKGARVWDVVLRGEDLAGSDEVNVYRRGRDLTRTIRLHQAFASYWEDSLEALPLAEGLVGAIRHGVDPAGWPEWARARIRTLDDGFSPSDAPLRVRPLFPYAHVVPTESSLPRPARLGSLGPAEASGWLGSFYASAEDAGDSGTGAEATWAALFALGQASRSDEVTASTASALGRALLESLGVPAHPALIELDEDWMLGREVDKDEPPWSEFATALGRYQGPALAARKAREASR